jgi:penicillin-binding protein 1B
MKRAVALPHYRDAIPFIQPAGVVDVRLDKLTNRLATGTCPEAYTAAFLAGTEPKETCDQSPGGRSILTRILGLGTSTPPPPPTTNGPVAGHAVPVPGQQAQAEEPKKKKGFFGKIVGIFKDDEPKQPAPAPPPPPTARDGSGRPR